MTDSDELVQIKKLARDFAEKEIRPRWEEIDCASPPSLSGILMVASELGIFSFMVDEDLGGSGLEPLQYAAFLEEISKAAAGMGMIFASHLMGLSPILLAGDTPSRRRLLPKIHDSEVEGGPLIFALALSEERSPEIRGLIPDIRATLTKKGRYHSLCGAKENVLCGSLARYLTVLVRDGDDKLLWVVVPSDLKGIDIKEGRPSLGLRLCPINNIVFDNVKIDKSDILIQDNPPDILRYYGYFDGPLAAVGLGMSRESYKRAFEYALERYQGGKMICDHDAMRIMLSDMVVSMEASKGLVYVSCKEAEKGNPSTSNILASVHAADVAIKVSIDAVQILGGYGYMKEYQVERIMRDAKTYQTAVVEPFHRKMEYIRREIEEAR